MKKKGRPRIYDWRRLFALGRFAIPVSAVQQARNAASARGVKIKVEEGGEEAVVVAEKK